MGTTKMKGNRREIEMQCEWEGEREREERKYYSPEKGARKI